MKTLSRLFVLLLVAASLPAMAVAAEPTAFERITSHYEAIRQALLHDTMDGVQAHARGLEREAKLVAQRFAPAAAGINEISSEKCQELLPQLANLAAQVAGSEDIGAARAAFCELSKPMVRYREMVSGTRPVVVYCPMAKKSWLQPEGEIGNPYFGQRMARCGEVVSR